eukprot:m.239054 g.239054  ORF g.239054 m.239054 type:complete len:168 (+) comp22254_c0_seq1:51-554(+)
MAQQERGFDPFSTLPGPEPHRREEIPHLVAEARRIVHTRPMAALECIISALRIQGGERAVLATMQRAREAYWVDKQAQHLAEHMSACVMEQLSLGLQESVLFTPEQIEALVKDSLLLEQGRGSIVESAAQLSNNHVCAQCGGLVSAERREAHELYWCEAAPDAMQET